MVQAYLLLQREMGRITRAQSLISKPIHTPTPHHSCLTFGSLRPFFEQRLQCTCVPLRLGALGSESLSGDHCKK